MLFYNLLLSRSRKQYLILAFLLNVFHFSNVLAQSAANCIGNRDYISVCDSLSQQNRCSTQLTRLCCDCQVVWGESFTYCDFNLTVFPTPSPTPTVSPTVVPTVEPRLESTPTPTATPTPTIFDEGDSGDLIFPTLHPRVRKGPIECVISVSHDQSVCSNVVEMVLDGTESSHAKSKTLTHSWDYECSENSKPLAPAIYRAGDVQTTAVREISPGQAILQIMEPAVGNEVRCNITLTVSAPGHEPVSCATALIIDNCELQCRSNYIFDTLVSLDGNADRSRKITRRMLRIVKGERGAQKVRRQLLRKANELFEETWSTIWSFPILSKTCGNFISCTSANYQQKLEGYDSRVSDLHKLNKKAYRMVEKYGKSLGLRSKAQRLRKQSLRILKRTRIQASERLPRLNSSCKPLVEE